MPLKKINLNLSKPYSIFVGQDLTSQVDPIARAIKFRNAVIISDSRLKDLSNKWVQALQAKNYNVHVIKVRAGESLKNIKNSFAVVDKLIAANCRRDSVIFAVGGGSVGDAVGFIASIYLRGVKWVGVPTTFLAQVDSSVGGKTAINHPRGKNLIGTFHQPVLVLCDVTALRTLSKREMISGLGEAVKYGLIYDRDLFLYIQMHWEKILQFNETVLQKIVFRCLKLKASVVEKDEFDIKGIREALNFGHTFGHALENVTHYKNFQHGEAVILGMQFSACLSFIKKMITLKEFNEINNFLNILPLPSVPRMKFQQILSAMQNDKKFRKGRLHFVLLKEIGRAYSDSTVTVSQLEAAYAKFLNVRKAL